MGKMLRIPGGEFQIGSPPWMLDWLDRADQPQHRIWFCDETPQVSRTVESFLIDKYPVTVGEFREFVDQTGYVTDAQRRGFSMIYRGDAWVEEEGARWDAPGGPGTDAKGCDDHPIVHISWVDANAYAEWAGKRLPTEPEWEFAARGTDFRIWPWGDTWHAGNANTAEFHAGTLTTLGAWQEWWASSCARRGLLPATTPVGAFSAHGDSVFDCSDMAGNVYEWTSSITQLYDDDVQCDPSTRMAIGRYRVIRGGSWMNFRYQTRCSERIHGDPAGWSSFAVGFRCAKDC